MGATRWLLTSELETVVDWFTYHMDSKMRVELMADLPQQYAKLYPNASAEVIALYVQQKIENEREAQA